MNKSTKVPERLVRLSRFMDSSIKLPGGYRIGWDGIVGLIPGIGDVVGLSVSAYIVFGAAQAGASAATLVRMVLTLAMEALVGMIPVLGDLFDLMFKANQRNMRLLERQLADGEGTSRSSKVTLIVLFSVILLVIIALAWIAIWLFAKLLGLFF